MSSITVFVIGIVLIIMAWRVFVALASWCVARILFGGENLDVYKGLLVEGEREGQRSLNET